MTVIITLIIAVAAVWLATCETILDAFWPISWRYKVARHLRRWANRVSPDYF